MSTSLLYLLIQDNHNTFYLKFIRQDLSHSVVGNVWALEGKTT